MKGVCSYDFDGIRIIGREKCGHLGECLRGTGIYETGVQIVFNLIELRSLELLGVSSRDRFIGRRSKFHHECGFTAAHQQRKDRKRQPNSDAIMFFFSSD